MTRVRAFFLCFAPNFIVIFKFEISLGNYGPTYI